MPQDDCAIRDWQELDKVLYRMRLLDATLAQIEAERDEAVARAAKPFTSRLDEFTVRHLNCEAGITEFCYAHRADFGKAKSRKLDNGRVGWKAGRKAIALLTEQKTWQTALDKVLAAGEAFIHWVRKPPPELAKDAILADVKSEAADGHTLRRFDLRIDEGDERFFVEPAAAPLRDREADGLPEE